MIFNVWVSILGLPENPDAWRQPPFEIDDPQTHERIMVNDERQMQKMFNSWHSNHFEYSLAVAHPITFIDKSCQEVIKRKKYCERFHVPPFAGDYDDQPEWWKKALILIEKATHEAEVFRAEKQKG